MNVFKEMFGENVEGNMILKENSLCANKSKEVRSRENIKVRR